MIKAKFCFNFYKNAKDTKGEFEIYKKLNDNRMARIREKDQQTNNGYQSTKLKTKD